MGTVGISFGSPTSGTGFDVSSTVSQIVANLENVETPWKTQLTKLDGQDTVLSNLGTLLSNLSTDVGQLTDFTGIMAQKTGSSSDTNVLELTNATSSAMAGTHTVEVNSLATTSSGYLAPITNSGDTLTGSITLKVGASGTAKTIDMSTLSKQTLAGLAAAINSSGVGITASVLTDSSGSRLSLVSGTSGAKGDIAVSANSIADATTPGGTLAYSSPISGADASLTVDGVTLSSASNTVTNLIPGVTFQLLAPSAKESDGSLEQVQVIIGNDNTAVESTVNQMVSDYNSLVSAINTQQGNDSSGTPEPLFGSPTLTLLEQQLLGRVNQQNPNGYLTPLTMNSSTALTGSMTIQVGSGTTQTVVIGAAPYPPAADTIYTGSVNTLQGLADAINAAAPATPVGFTSSASDSGTITASNTSPLTGTLKIKTGSGSTQTIYLGSSSNAPTGDLATGNPTDTLSSLETYINGNSTTLGVTASIVDNGDGTSTLSLASSDSSALTATSGLAIPGLGVTAGITTSNGQSTLSLLSETAGSAGALNVTSSVTATGDTLLGFTGISGGGGSNASGGLDPIPSAGDILSGSVTIQVGNGTAQTVDVPASPDATLQGLADAINGTSGIGVIASVLTSSDGQPYLELESQTAGTAGNLTVTSNVLDTTNATTTSLDYTNSSDVSTLANLGITVSQKDDGSLTFDANTLDTALNTDFAGVLGFFQNVNSWGQSFAAMLENAGTSSPTGVVTLAQKANSSTETTLNAEISKEESLISAEQKSLTAELTSANEILQALPSQLQGVNELYSAISGYNQNHG